jgi:hypothetical protein
MTNILKKLTLFFILGIIYIFGGIIYAIILITGNSAQNGLLGIYILFSVIPVLYFYYSKDSWFENLAAKKLIRHNFILYYL